MLGKPGDSIHWLTEVDWRSRGRIYGFTVSVNMHQIGHRSIAPAMAYLQVVTMASSLSSLRHVRLLHRRPYSIITELVALLRERFSENPSLHVSDINIAVPCLKCIEAERKGR